MGTENGITTAAVDLNTMGDQQPDQQAQQPPAQNSSAPPPQTFKMGDDELTPVDGTEKPAAPQPHKFAGEELTPIEGSERKVTQVPAPHKTDELLPYAIAKVKDVLHGSSLYSPVADSEKLAQAKLTSDYIYNNILGKDTYQHSNLSYDQKPSSAWEFVKQRFWGWATQDEINKIPGLEPDRVETLRQQNQDTLGTYFSKDKADYLRDNILHGFTPEVIARAGAKSLTDFFSPGYLALSAFGQAARGYQKAAQVASAAGNLAEAATAMGKARLLGLLGVGVNIPFGASQAHDLVENWEKMSVPERVAAVSGILAAGINTHTGILTAGNAADHSGAEVKKAYTDVGNQIVKEAPKAAIGIAKNAGSKAAGVLDTALFSARTFEDATTRAMDLTKKQKAPYAEKLKNVSQDMQAILNNNAGKITGPKSFGDAIDDHIQETEKQLQKESGATKDDQQPVVANSEQRLRDKLDEFFDSKRGKYGSAAEVDKAKQEVMDRVLQNDTSVPGLSTTRAPNLFESENVRQGLNIDSKPQFAANAKPTSDAYKIGAKVAADELRSQIDEAYHARGVKNVKEFRAKEPDLIDIRDRLYDAQATAEKLGQPGLWDALVKKYGSPATITAIAFGTHNPLAFAALAPYLATYRAYHNMKNPNVNVGRAAELAAPTARATEVEFNQPGQTPPPTTPGPSSIPPAGGTPNAPAPPSGAPQAAPQPPVEPHPPIPPQVAADAAREAAPAHMEEPPAAHELNATLSTYFGDPSTQTRTLDQKLDLFKNEVEAAQKSGVDLTPKQAQVLAKVHQAEAMESQVVEDHQNKTAEEAQKNQEETVKAHAEERKKYEEDLKKYEEAQEADKAAAEEAKKVKAEPAKEGERSPLTSEAVGSHASEATEPIQKTPKAELPAGHTDDSLHGHEYGHLAQAAFEGIKGTDFASYLHPEVVASGGAGGVAWQEHPFAAEENAEENHTPEEIWDNTKKWLRIYMGGAAANELLHGMDAKTMRGLKGDLRMAEGLLRQHGISGEDADIMVQEALRQAKEHLSKPGVLDAIKANSKVREENLPETLHASAGRVENFQNQVKGLHDNQNGQSNNEGGAGSSEVPTGNKEGNRAAGEERGQRAALQVDKAAKGLTERTVGSPENDKAIRDGGGVPAGVLGDLKGDHVKMFHDPQTGTTLGLPGTVEVTPEAVKAKLTESRRQYAAAELPKEDFSGTHYSNVAAENGTLSGATRGASKAGSEQARIALGAEPGIYAYREGAKPEPQIGSRTNKYGIEGKKAIADISGAQKDLFQNAYQEAKNAALKAGDNDTVAGHKGLNAAETAVKNAGYDGYENKTDYPGSTFLFGDQKVGEPNNWVKKAEATKGEGFSFHPATGEAPTDGYMVETHLDRGQQYDHPPTAEDIRAFTEKNKDVLSKNPDLYVGGYKNSLGISERLTNQAAAEDLGQKTNQISIYDVKNGKEIPTGGTGEVAERSALSKDKSPKGSSVPLMENPLPMKGTMEGGEVGTLDLTKALNKFSRQQNPALEPGSEPKEMVERAKKIAEDEAKYQLAQSKTGTEWYTTEMKDHDKVLQDLRPELAQGETTAGTDGHPVNLTLFKAAEAILSSGQKPYANVKSALKAWDVYKETGQFPPTNPAPGKEGMSWGPRGAAGYGNAFEAVNKLIADKGEKGAADWLIAEHPVSELKEYGENVSGKKDDMKAGAAILGEKRGPFMQNLHGIESKFTADMWVSRTWNRWMGTLDLDPRIENKGKMTSESDSPRNNTERALMKESFEKTANKLKLTTSSLQAVLWYYEQALYRAHGLPVESWSFSDAAKRVAKEHNAVPESEQTGFNFGENATKGGLDALKGETKNPDAVHAFDFINALKKK